MRRWGSYMAILLLLCTVITGCLYPQEKRQEWDKLDQHLARVQAAVDTYLKQQKMLPYKYSQDDIKWSTRYQVDFMQIQGYLGEIPPSAFEKGGYFIYVMTDVETKPLVRLFDLRIHDAVDKVQMSVNAYKAKEGKYPLGETVAPHFYKVDMEKLDLSDVHVVSPYSPDTMLDLIMDDRGRVYVDYRSEVMKKWQYAKEKPSEAEDLRAWLAKDSYFVPGYSPMMQMKKNTPEFIYPAEEMKQKSP
ncbi:hypothetical protein [Laceyella putida]|uniref:Lipoprotein n=1 Tax=Laceyella putida TaxID=110101 RepID=A0ABW2RMC6_9BACL